MQVPRIPKHTLSSKWMRYGSYLPVALVDAFSDPFYPEMTVDAGIGRSSRFIQTGRQHEGWYQRL